jgi:hypothetical protein
LIDIKKLDIFGQQWREACNLFQFPGQNKGPGVATRPLTQRVIVLI